MSDRLPLITSGMALIAQRCPLYGLMMRLRIDAVERGMFDLATVYGYSAIRLGTETLGQIRRTG
jgi:hypothetical protein